MPLFVLPTMQDADDQYVLVMIEIDDYTGPIGVYPHWRIELSAAPREPRIGCDEAKVLISPA